MPQELKITTYTLRELKTTDEKAFLKALEWVQLLQVDDSWWTFIYEDAGQIDFEITSFDLDRAATIEGRFEKAATDTMEKILTNHGADCDTYVAALAFKAAGQAAAKIIDEDKALAALDDAEIDFKNAILKAYWLNLKSEYEYLLDAENCIEVANVNEYLFDATGRPIHQLKGD